MRAGPVEIIKAIGKNTISINHKSIINKSSRSNRGTKWHSQDFIQRKGQKHSNKEEILLLKV